MDRPAALQQASDDQGVRMGAGGVVFAVRL